MPSEDYSDEGESNYEPSPIPKGNQKEKMVSNMPYDEALELSQARTAAPALPYLFGKKQKRAPSVGLGGVVAGGGQGGRVGPGARRQGPVRGRGEAVGGQVGRGAADE